VTREELDEMRRKRISTLIYPLNTVLDDSLGCALWFASRGKGCLHPGDAQYSSHATVRTLNDSVYKSRKPDSGYTGPMIHVTEP